MKRVGTSVQNLHKNLYTKKVSNFSLKPRMNKVEKVSLKQNSSKQEIYISLTEASRLSCYSQEYLSLRARQGRLKAKKFGRNWKVSYAILADYISRNRGQEEAEKVLSAYNQQKKTMRRQR